MQPTFAGALRPSPLDVGGVLGGAFRIFRDRFGLFALLATLPVLLGFVAICAALVPIAIGVFWSLESGRFSSLIIIGFLAVWVALFASVLVQIKMEAMMTLAAHDAALGQPPAGFGELSRRTSGVIGRVLVVVLVVTGAALVAYGMLAGFFIAAGLVGFGAALDGGGNSSGSALGALLGAYLLVMIIVVVLGIAVFLLQVRLLYFLPGVAVAGHSAMGALGESWRMTKGNFWRTLGYYLVMAIVVWMANSIVSVVGNVVSSISGLASSQGMSGSESLSASMLAMLPATVILALLQLAVQILALPLRAIYVTVMYVDQRRRHELVPMGPAAGTPAPPAAQVWQQPSASPWGQHQPPQNPPQWGSAPQNPPPQNPPPQSPPAWGPGPRQWGPPGQG